MRLTVLLVNKGACGRKKETESWLPLASASLAYPLREVKSTLEAEKEGAALDKTLEERENIRVMWGWLRANLCATRESFFFDFLCQKTKRM